MYRQYSIEFVHHPDHRHLGRVVPMNLNIPVLLHHFPNRLELLLGLLRDSVVALDDANRILFMNQAPETLFSVSRSGVAGQPFADVIGISVMIDLIQNADARQSEQALEVQWEAGEETRYGSVYMAPLRIDEGGGPGWLIVIRDVTENRRFEALRRDFSSNVSHELKTPVAAIGALLDALKEGASDEPGTREAFLDRIRIQNERLARLIEELLAISRVEQDKAIFSWDRMDLRRVVELTRETFSAVADLRGIEFQVECGSEEVPVRGDSRALELLINSLVDNAFKYTKEGGRVLVRIEREKEVGGGHRHRDRSGAWRSDIRALLPHRCLAIAGERWQRPGSRHRQAHGLSARRHGGTRQRGWKGKPFPSENTAGLGGLARSGARRHGEEVGTSKTFRYVRGRPRRDFRPVAGARA